MNGGGCDRCFAWTMQGARTPFQESKESKNRILCAAARIDPMALCPTHVPATCPVCVSCDTRSTCPLLLLPSEVVLRVLRVLCVLRLPPMLPLLLPLELPLVCCVFYRVSFLNNRFL